MVRLLKFEHYMDVKHKKKGLKQEKEKKDNPFPIPPPVDPNRPPKRQLSKRIAAQPTKKKQRRN